MKTDKPIQLLGGLTPDAFMRDYWQRKPLLIRQAIPGFKPPLSVKDIRSLVARDEVESRLIRRDEAGWHMDKGPFTRLPRASTPNWTLLAQSVDLHHDAIADLMHQFRFISDARLDDAMISIASDGGGVGPHFDSYDVFLLQAHGRRRWRISQQQDLSLEPGLPLKILSHFQAEQDYILEAGDMLYLPPHAAHDGVAQGNDCMTISIGFRAPTLAVLARGLLEAAGDQLMARAGSDSGLYGATPLPGPTLSDTFKDRGVHATTAPAQLPETLIEAAIQAVKEIRFDEALAARFLGLWLTEPSQAAYFAPPDDADQLQAGLPEHGVIVLDRCTRMMYRGEELYINGELAEPTASAALCELADNRRLPCTHETAARLLAGEIEAMKDWLTEGWMHYRHE